ncbi:MAG: 2-C-methyl-D-erythritol 4-phosphate cytidylyltransferase [Armatimonadota bacterium]
MKTTAIIMAAGRGERLGLNINKVFFEIYGKSILERSIQAFEDCREINQIIVVTAQDDIQKAESIVANSGFKKITKICCGGETRQQSVTNGLKYVEGEITAVHDAARPFVSSEIIINTINTAKEYGSAIAGVPVIDTIKKANDNVICETVDRSYLYSIQTPQTFKTDILKSAYNLAEKDGFIGTDDAGLVERLGQKVRIVMGSYKNIKITTPSDLEYAAFCCGENDIRIGTGMDVHQLVENRKLILGGVDIDFHKGLLGHSDADVLVHAIMDALLGACSLGDIGKHFPDNDNKYKDISSIYLLEQVGKLLSDKGWQIINIDSVIAAQKPKLAEFIPQMQKNIAKSLKIDGSRVSVKATTTEKLGFVGREEGIMCNAVASVKKKVS